MRVPSRPVAACLSLALFFVLAVAVWGPGSGSDDSDSDAASMVVHEPMSFMAAAGDWTVSPTARSLLGTGCQCNVQIVGGFNGSKGEPGKDGIFKAGDVLDRPTIVGEVVGGASYVGIVLRDATVRTGLSFQASDSSGKRVMLAPPDSMPGANYTIKLPAAPPAGARAFLQVDADDGNGAVTTKWSTTLTSPMVAGATITGSTLTAPAIEGGTLSNAILAGHVRASDTLLAAADSSCTGSATSANGVLTMQSGGCVLTSSSAGGVVQWANTARSSRLVRVLTALSAEIAELSESTVHVTQSTFAPVRVFHGGQSFSASPVHTTMQVPTIYEGDKSVKLSLAPMASGTSANWSFPSTSATDTLVGAGATQTLANKVLLAPTIDGGVSVTGSPQMKLLMATQHTTKPAGHSCTGGTVTSTSTLTVATGPCSFTARTVGALIRWGDGTTSRVIAFVAVRVLNLSTTDVRTNAPFTIFNSDQHFSADGTFTNMRLPLVMHDARASVRLAISPTSTDLATWSFPASTLSADDLASTDTQQTLTDKTLAAPVLAGVTVVPANAGIQFAPATTTTWDALNAAPVAGRARANGTNVLGTFETLSAAFRLDGHIRTLDTAVRWTTLRLTRIDSIVTMCYDGIVVGKAPDGGFPADAIKLHASTPLPDRFAPAASDAHFIVHLADTGVQSAGKLIVRAGAGGVEFYRNAAGDAFPVVDQGVTSSNTIYPSCVTWAV